MGQIGVIVAAPPHDAMFLRSFRARLSWFFVIIVILPIVMVTVVLFRLVVGLARPGGCDARLAQAQTSAGNLYGTTQERAARGGARLAASRPLAEAVASDDQTRIRRRSRGS